jgi:hypothetical protein
MTSAYPVSPEVLEDRVRTLAASLGDWPSQRRVMRECRVGAPRADAALTAVRASGFDPDRPARPLTVVPDQPDTTTAHTTDAHTTDANDTDRGAGDGRAPVLPTLPLPDPPATTTTTPDHVTQVIPVPETPTNTPTEAPARRGCRGGRWR